MYFLTANHLANFFRRGLASSLVVVCAACLASFLASGSAVAQAEYFWSFHGTDGRGVANLAGCKQCDDIELSLYCTTGEDQIMIVPFIDVKEGEDMDTADITFTIDTEKTITVETFMELNLMEDILQPVVEITNDNPLLAALILGSNLEISIRGQQSTYDLKTAGQAIGGMLDFCKNPAAAE